MGRAADLPYGAGLEGASVPAAAALARRVLSAAVLLPVVGWLVLGAPAWLYGAAIVAISARGQWEFTGLFARAGVRTLRLAGLVGGALLTASFAWPGAEGPALTLVVLALLSAALYRPAGSSIAWEPVAVTALGIVYVNWLLGYGVRLRELDGGPEWIVLLVWVTWLGETAAYGVGSLLGRHKLAPVVSPNKTVEGAAAQVVVSVAAALAAQAWFMPGLRPAQAIAVGLLLGVAGQVGDLFESVLKRSVGAKDAGQLIPGHGGILDRLDGLLFNAPVLFYYASWTRALAA